MRASSVEAGILEQDLPFWKSTKHADLSAHLNNILMSLKTASLKDIYCCSLVFEGYVVAL